MTLSLSEVYFYMIIIICQFLSFILIVTSEDLKNKKCCRKYFNAAILIGCVGILMELLNWNYLLNFQCILLTFSPFITLNIVKGLMFSLKKIFKNEPHMVSRGELMDGIYTDNQGDLKYENYYQNYSIIILLIPMSTLAFLFHIIEIFQI